MMRVNEADQMHSLLLSGKYVIETFLYMGTIGNRPSDKATKIMQNHSVPIPADLRLHKQQHMFPLQSNREQMFKLFSMPRLSREDGA